ncbi:DUF4248 domain-containing protein [Bacteroides fluxus]
MNAIYMSDLAQAYFLNSTTRSASAQLHRWIQLNPELQTRLEELHYKPRKRALTPLQHEATIECLGRAGGVTILLMPGRWYNKGGVSKCTPPYRHVNSPIYIPSFIRLP